MREFRIQDNYRECMCKSIKFGGITSLVGGL